MMLNLAVPVQFWLLLSRAGKWVFLDLTRGELGTRGTPEIRIEEAEAAARILGVSVRDNVGLADGFFQNDPPNQLALVPYIRKYRPEIVLANAIEDRHPDHGKGAKLIYDACFLAGLRRIETVDTKGNHSGSLAT